MASRLFLSFSLVLSLHASADHYRVTNQPPEQEVLKEEAPSDEAVIQPVADPSKQEAAQGSNEKRQKPHFVGVRRPQPKPSSKRKSSKIKNQWFSSKTHPKADKKKAAREEVEEPMEELPDDSPFYISQTKLTAQNTLRSPTMMEGREMSVPMSHPTEEKEEAYPQEGFHAPRGHVYLTAEYLLWRTRQEGMEYATGKKVNFEFDSGFRAGLGVHMPGSGWDIYANYTRFIPVQSRTVQGSFYPLFLFQGSGSPQGSAVSHAHAHWEIEYQAADLEIGWAFYLAKTLALRPFFGLKGAWIDQDAKFNYGGGFIPVGQTFHTHLKNDFKGAGPLIGIQSNWELGAGFSLFANAATALVVGHFDNKQEQRQLSEVVDFTSHNNFVSPFLQMIAGLAWDRNFNQERSHVGLNVGFEVQNWWNQNQTEQYTDRDLPIYVRNGGNLSFYGLTAQVRFDF
jgi:hypothetical protein